MKISLQWIQRHVSIEDLDPKAIADELSIKTCEVEAVHSYGDQLDDIVIGKVVNCGKHPNADKLSLTAVDIGGQELSIVCGAPNVAKGQTVAVVPVGARLPDGTKIRKTKIRGVESQGK